MKRYLVVSLVLLAFVLPAAAGCGGGSGGSSELTREKYDQITVGMAAEKVKAIAGEPSRTETKTMAAGEPMGGMVMTGDMVTEYWYYQGDKGWVRLEITDGRMTSKSGY